jgi:hypothetical protein
MMSAADTPALAISVMPCAASSEEYLVFAPARWRVAQLLHGAGRGLVAACTCDMAESNSMPR